jgi:PadR family transcriptional regulator PadR
VATDDVAEERHSPGHAGTLALLVLKTLASNKRMHGYAITTHIRRVSADLLRVEEGSLYPALHRMEQLGWLRSEWASPKRTGRLASIP